MAYCEERLAVMRFAHSLRFTLNLDLLRSFFAIVEQGSLNKAAERLRVSQSTLTRQMQALEQEVGGPLLERSPGGVALTATGHTLLEGSRPVLARFDAVMADVRQRARGQSADLRIGYLMSAVSDYLNPALAALRKAHPEVKVKMRDLSPGEQIEALRNGEIDVALIGQAGALLAKEFYVKTLAMLPVWVAMAEDHPLAKREAVKLGDLKKEVFVGAPDADMPGHNQWLAQLCKRAGFRARFVQNADSLTHGLSLIVTEGAMSLQPGYVEKLKVPGVVFRPLRDSAASWELMVAWQRGKTTAPVKALLDALPVKRK
ncbi:MAG: LysR family transcriptional regulator [Rariglobus sp.]|nr:LysR family transcriptional regulator [Rariglobus sp.]